MRIILDCDIAEADVVLSLLTDNVERLNGAKCGYGWTFHKGEWIRAFVRRTKTGFSVTALKDSRP